MHVRHYCIVQTVRRDTHITFQILEADVDAAALDSVKLHVTNVSRILTNVHYSIIILFILPFHVLFGCLLRSALCTSISTYSLCTLTFVLDHNTPTTWFMLLHFYIRVSISFVQCARYNVSSFAYWLVKLWQFYVTLYSAVHGLQPSSARSIYVNSVKETV